MSCCKKLFVPTLLAAFSLAAVVATVVIAEPAKDAKPSSPEFQLPPGWTEADMQACMAAGTPGEKQALLAEGAGVWHGKNTMWMSPDGPPMESESETTVTPIMDGRYVKVEVAGDMPGMGPFSGIGLYGFDNVSQKFVCTWIDSQSTGIMNGTGKLSPDGKTLTWTYNYNCPVTKKPAVMREVQTATGPDTKTIEMFTTEPKSGKEFKMMSMELTKK